MTAELSSPPGRQRKRKVKRDPWDFYVEEAWVTERLCDFVEFEEDVHYWDPACGLGTIPRVLAARGLKAFGTDKFCRANCPLVHGEHDFIGKQMLILQRVGSLSIVMNPPFSNQDGKIVRGLAEKFVREALEWADHKVCVLLPLKWLASAGRFRLFSEFPPTIFILCERPSMPPGHMIEQLGKDAFKRGKVDFMWLVWDKRAPLTEARTFWIPRRELIVPAMQLDLAA